VNVRLVAVLACAAAVLASGCASRLDAEPAARRVRVDPAATPEVDFQSRLPSPPPLPPAANPMADDPSLNAPGSYNPYPPLKAGQTGKIWGDMPLEIELTPTCATVGTAMRAVVRTVPGASVGGAVRYADNDPHGDLTWGPRVPTGEHVWTWTIKPGVPTGLATAMVTAGKSGESGAAVQAAFDVAETC
jgi:hypothetical protein